MKVNGAGLAAGREAAEHADINASERVGAGKRRAAVTA